ncbi:VOC family protein [Brachybacterium sp. AOP25-B2-12]|uniref:VOC family protein n=1 Tax=Brachybacterium sp. AOP25-B2-12 TaxID=3457710 RepID=UPI0040348347
MPAPVPYLLLPGTARAALELYARVFGGEVTVYTHADFHRDSGTPEAVAHGGLDGTVSLFAADAEPDAETLRAEGLFLSLLGAAEPSVLHAWFDALAEGGTVVDALAVRPWGDTDGTVRDRFGVTWLIGYQPS